MEVVEIQGPTQLSLFFSAHSCGYYSALFHSIFTSLQTSMTYCCFNQYFSIHLYIHACPPHRPNRQKEQTAKEPKQSGFFLTVHLCLDSALKPPTRSSRSASSARRRPPVEKAYRLAACPVSVLFWVLMQGYYCISCSAVLKILSELRAYWYN